MSVRDLSDADLMAQINATAKSPVEAVHTIETGGAPDTSTATSPKGASGAMQVMPATGAQPGFGVRPSNGTPKDKARVGREYLAALQKHYGNNENAAIAYNMGPTRTDKWLKGGANLRALPDETIKYLLKYKDLTQKGNPVQQIEQLGEPSFDPSDVPRETFGPPVSAKPMGYQQEAAANFMEKVMKVPPAKARALAAKAPEFIADVPGGAGALSRIIGPVKKALGIGGQVATPEILAAQAARAKGFKVPPSQLRPGPVTETLEGFGGKAVIERMASRANEPVARNLIAQDLGLPKGTELTHDVLEQVIEEGGKPYQEIRNLPMKFSVTGTDEAAIAKLGKEWREASREFPDMRQPEIDELVSSSSRRVTDPNTGISYLKKIDPNHAIDRVKFLRANARANLANYSSPEKQALGKAQRDAAEIFDNIIERNLKTKAPGDLYQRYRQGRTMIAKASEAMKATNPSTGTVNAKKYADMLAQGKPLTGGAQAVGETAAALPRSMQRVEMLGAQPRFSVLDTAWGLAHAARHPGLAAAAIARPAVRSLLLSDAYQTGMPQSIKEMVDKAILEAAQVSATQESENGRKP